MIVITVKYHNLPQRGNTTFITASCGIEQITETRNHNIPLDKQMDINAKALATKLKLPAGDWQVTQNNSYERVYTPHTDEIAFFLMESKQK